MISQEFINRHLNNRTILSYLLSPFSVIYSHILLLRRLILKRQSWKASVKVLSVGNIVSGGTGKTPYTIYLAHLLTSRGYKVAVSHRDYKGGFEHDTSVISNDKGLYPIANNACDEALLIAESLPGIAVAAGKDRKKAIRLLLQENPKLDFVILDDSFQNLKVYHDIDFILFKTPSPIGNGFVIPAGKLRESLKAVKYADVLVVTGDSEIPIEISRSKKPILKGQHRLAGIYDATGKTIKSEVLMDCKIALISGLGNPLSFEKSVKDSGIVFAKHFIYPDHYGYNDKQDMEQINSYIISNKIDYLLTTEKDFVKLKKYSKLPLAVLKIKFTPSNPEILSSVISKIID